MTANEWLGVMQKASDFPKGMEKLITKYGDMRVKEAEELVKNCFIPDVIKLVCEMCGEEKELQSDNLCKDCYDSLPS